MQADILQSLPFHGEGPPPGDHLPRISPRSPGASPVREDAMQEPEWAAREKCDVCGSPGVCVVIVYGCLQMHVFVNFFCRACWEGATAWLDNANLKCACGETVEEYEFMEA